MLPQVAFNINIKMLFPVTFFIFFANSTTHLLSKMLPVVMFSKKQPIIELMFINGSEFLTVKEMADRLRKNRSAVKTLLFRYGYEPISRDALYPAEAFEAIKEAPLRGRPKKPKE